jgi:hypothetical protein
MTPLQLVSQRQEIERPSNWDLAKRLLRENLRENRGKYELWTHGQWVPANVDSIMLRANTRLKNLGRAQFPGKLEWVAP